MSCAINTLSARTVYVASTTSRSFSARTSSSSSAIQRSSQGNSIQNSKLHDARAFSSVPKWNGDDGAIFGLTASAFLYAGFASAYLANNAYDEVSTAQCSSVGMLHQHDTVVEAMKEAILPDSLSSKSSTSLIYKPNADALKSSMLEVVDSSVKKASTWEKKAKAVVNDLRTPPQYDVSVRALRGGRLSMEDTFCIHDGGRFAGVFDGHGGADVSKYTSKSIYDKINKFRTRFDPSPTSGPTLASLVKSISFALEEIDNEVLTVDDYQYQGSTAVAVYLHEDDLTNERTIISANIGDSRAILSRGSVAIDLTRDHKPEFEKNRILAMGETIEWDSDCNVFRVKNLSLSRALGDRFAKPVVSGEPDIQLFPLNDYPTTKGGEDDCIILASDGLWDVITSQDCVNFINQRLAPSEAQYSNMSRSELLRQKISRRKNMGRFLANEAIRRGSYDNVCVVVMWLDEPRGSLSD